MKNNAPTGSEKYQTEYQNLSYSYPRFFNLLTSYVISHESSKNQGFIKHAQKFLIEKAG